MIDIQYKIASRNKSLKLSPSRRAIFDDVSGSTAMKLLYMVKGFGGGEEQRQAGGALVRDFSTMSIDDMSLHIAKIASPVLTSLTGEGCGEYDIPHVTCTRPCIVLHSPLHHFCFQLNGG